MKSNRRKSQTENFRIRLHGLWFFFLVCVLFISFITLSGGKVFAGSPDISMKISRTGSKKTRVAVPLFVFKGITGRRDLENFSGRSADILMADLKESGYFRSIDNRQFIKEMEESDRKNGFINFLDWKTIGAEGIAKGRVLKRGATITIEGAFYDVQSGRKILEVKYDGRRSNFREMIHRFSDEIVLQFVGNKGIATTKLAFSSLRGKHKEIYLCDYDGRNLKRLTYDQSINLFPEWSPDGKYISYTTFKYRNPDLYLINVKTRMKAPLSAESGMNASGTWSPDGKKLALSMSRDGNSEIYVITRSGSRRERLSHRRTIEISPAWSPKGNLIAFTSDRSGTPQVYVMDSEGANVRRVTYNGHYNDQADWSPDGSKIAFSSMSRGHFDIYVINLATDKLTRLTVDSRDNQNPSWSPDGKKIAFSSNRNGSDQIFTMDSNGSNQKQLLYLEGGGYDPTWSPRYSESEFGE